jgi:FAD:protein FMN transferase
MNRPFARVDAILTAFLYCLLLGACARPAAAAPHQAVTKRQLMMSTVIALTIYDPKSDAVFTEIFDRMADIERKMSVQKPDSEVSKVNAMAGKAPVVVSADTYAVMKRALTMSSLSGGAFDPTIGPIVDLWNVAGDNPHVATAKEIGNALPLVDWRQVETDDAARSIFLKKPGMKLDFGGIAKGFAADEAARIAKKDGVVSALFNMGDSSIYVMGSKPDGVPWRIGVQNPVSDENGEVIRDRYLGIFECSDADVETSGPYERFFMKDGKRYHHIMDPKTGMPADNGLIQVTLIMPNDVDLPDGLSTSCFVLGLQKGMKLIESLPGVGAVFVTADNKAYISSRAASKFSFSEGTGITLGKVRGEE